MRPALLAALTALLIVPFLAACGPNTPVHVPQAKSHLDVASPDLVAFKKQTDVPNCPKVSASGVDGGMPSVTVPCLGGGRAVDVAGLRGPMIVNFWASWCGDCRKEMPALAAYARSHPDVKILGVDYLDTQPGAALELAEKSRVGYPLVADTSAALDKARPLPHIVGLPFTAFVDARGRVVHLEAGAMETTADVAAQAQKYLGVGG
jgi:thiol-disulfide isomerase/thioredoxin